jgi:hypothetical protein
MSAVTAAPLLTSEELLALPDDDEIARELFRGELREAPMTKRSVGHSKAVSTVSAVLTQWCNQRRGLRGMVVGGEAACRIRRDPDTTIGVDVAQYVAPDLAARTAKKARFVDGAPVLAVEVLSPSIATSAWSSQRVHVRPLSFASPLPDQLLPRAVMPLSNVREEPPVILRNEGPPSICLVLRLSVPRPRTASAESAGAKGKRLEILRSSG